MASTVQSCVRAALGQLLEYAYWPPKHRASELIIVGEAALDAAAVQYLQFLREKFHVPLWYRRLDIEQKTLDERT